MNTVSKENISEIKTIIRLNSELIGCLEKNFLYPAEPGSYNVGVRNKLTGKNVETQGDISQGETWKDFSDWLLQDMKEMKLGKLSELTIEYVEVA